MSRKERVFKSYSFNTTARSTILFPSREVHYLPDDDDSDTLEDNLFLITKTSNNVEV